MSPENEAMAALLGYSHKAIKEIDGVLYDYAYVRDWLCADIDPNCSPVILHPGSYRLRSSNLPYTHGRG